ncbi:MAG: hypothetical protein DRG82_16985, partial [Deltaproteobacteria bacterium]
MKEEKKSLVLGFYILFFLSGVSGLVYQSLWLRMFTLVLGNSLHSASLVFASFMCGLALGAWLLGRYIRSRKDPLAVYVVLELGIAVTALTVGKLIPHSSSFVFYFHSLLSANPLLFNLFRVTVSFLILLPSTALIGGTLPVLTHFLTHSLEVAGKKIGALYGWNTVGAVFGCALTGFWLLRVVGMSASLHFAAAINIFVAVGAVVLRFFTREKTAEAAGEIPRIQAMKSPGSYSIPLGLKRLLIAAAGVTGAVSLAYEVVWARFLSYILQNDIYAYYLMLSTMLLGIGTGSLIYSKWLDRPRRRLRWLAVFEISLGLVVVLCYLLCAGLYLWPGNAILHISLQNFFSRIFPDPFYSLISIRLLYTLVAMFLPTMIMGIVFPLICRLYFTDEKSIGGQTGAIYALNTAGAMVGALAAGFFLVPKLGVQSSLFIMAGGNLVLGSILFFYERSRRGTKPGWGLIPYWAAVTLFSMLCFIPGNQIRGFALKDKKH